VLVDFQGFGKTPLASRTARLSISGHVSDIHDLVTFFCKQSCNGVEKG